MRQTPWVAFAATEWKANFSDVARPAVETTGSAVAVFDYDVSGPAFQTLRASRGWAVGDFGWRWASGDCRAEGPGFQTVRITAGAAK